MPQLTNWHVQSEKLRSQYGQVTYLKWCLLEQERFARRGRRVEVIQDGKLCALFVAPLR
jgi:hypothetical protein